MILIFLIFSSSLLTQPSDQAWDLLVHKNQYLASRLAYEDLLSTDPANSYNNIGWFLTFTGKGPTADLLMACETVLERVPPGSPAAEFVLIWMQPMRAYLPRLEETLSSFVLAELPPQLRAGGFSIIKSNYMMRLAKQRGDEKLYERARNESFTLKKWLFAPITGQYPIPDFHKTRDDLDWQNGYKLESLNGTIVPPPKVSGSGVLFATSRFSSPVAQSLVLRLFSYQNIAVFIDGKHLLTQAGRETLGSVIRAVSFSVDEGEHEIVVKTTQTGKRNGHFQMQLTGLDDLTFLEADSPKHALSGSVASIDMAASGIQAMIELADNQEHQGLRSFISALLFMREKNFEPSIKALEELVHKHPDSQLLGGQLIKFYLDGVSFMSQEKQVGRAYGILKRLSSAGPDMLPENKLLLSSVLIKAKQTKDALAFLQQLTEENPEYCEALELLLALADRENLYDIKEDTLDRMKHLGPDHRWAQEKLLDQAQRDGNMEEAKNLLANLRHLFPWGKYESEYHDTMGQYDQAIASLEKQMKYFPNSTYYPYAISKQYRKLGDTDNQYLWLEKTRKLDPTHRSALVDMVNIDLYRGNSEEARRKLDEFLTLVPHDGTIRQMKSHLRGETYFEPFRVDTASVIEASATQKKSEGADSELLLDQLMVRLFPDGSQLRYTHLVTRVLTKAGIDRESEIRLPSHCEVLELRTIKQDGKIFYPENIKNKNTLSLSGISVGDFIDEEHIEYLPPAYYDKDGLDGGMSFIFRGIDRIFHHSECVLIYPENLPVEPQYYEINFPDQVEKTVKSGLIYLRWVAKNVPPLVPEPAMPNPAQLMPRVSFSYNTSWEEIRDFFMNVTQSKMKVTQALTDMAEQWKTEYPEPKARAEAIYRFLTDEIEPSRNFYQDVNLTWENRKGNATLLMAALYPLAGIPCTVAYSRTRSFEKSILDTPFPDLFFRAFLVVHLPLKTLWLDANMKNLPFGYISPDFFGAKAIYLDPEADPVTWVPAQNSEFEPVESSYRLVIQSDGSLMGWGEERFNGTLAAHLTGYYRDMKEEERLKKVEAGVNDRFPQSTVSQVFVDDKPEPGHFSLNYSFDASHWVSVSADGIEIPYPLPHSPLRDHYANLATRTFPVDIESGIENIASMSVRLPEGYIWHKPELKKHIESEFGTYDLNVESISDSEIQVKRSYRLPARKISLEDYPEFQKFCQNILDAEQITLKAGSDSPKEPK